MENPSVDFQKVTYENVEKKRSFCNKHIYVYGSQIFWNFMNFYFVHIVKICFVFKKTVIMLIFLHI